MKFQLKRQWDRGYLVKYEWIRHLDNVDYSNIRWNGRRYYEDDLNDLLVIDERDDLIVKKFKDNFKIIHNFSYGTNLIRNLTFNNEFTDKNIEKTPRRHQK